MSNFEVVKIGKHSYSILDEKGASFYIVEGEKKAAVIDTGITKDEKIMPIIRRYTDKPLILVITHAHLDHMYHMDEFDEIYMSHKELTMPKEWLEAMKCGKELDFEKTIDVHTDSIIELGDVTLEICEIAGHTPGSIGIWDRQENYLYTGDAIGSGIGVWMQITGGVTLREYYKSLTNLMQWLMKRGGRMKFFGGHNHQQYENVQFNGYNPLSMGVLADMIDLVDQILKGEIVGRSSDVVKSFSLEPALQASYGRAQIQYLSSGM